MKELDGIAESTWEAFVACAMENKRRGSMQSVGMWSLKTEGHTVHGVLWI
jgi:hypothetical protein